MFSKIASLGAVLALLASASLAGAAPAQPASTRCETTNRPRWQCCGSKAVPSPPCCQKRCATAGQIVRP